MSELVKELRFLADSRQQMGYDRTGSALDQSADRIEKLEAALRDAESDGWERGMRDAATICATLAETTYDDADSFEAATGCEAAIESDICIHQRARTALGGEG